jgi:PAS domain S-box-containing protein
VVAAASFLRLRGAEGRYARLFEADSRALLSIPRMNVALHDAARISAQRANSTMPDEAARLDRELAAVRTRMAQETAGLRTAMPEYSRVSTDFDRAFNDMLSAAQHMRDVVSSRHSEAARMQARQQFLARFEKLRAFLQALGDQIRDRMIEEARQAEIVADRIIRHTLLMAVIALAGGLVLAQVWVWRWVALPLRALVTTVRRLVAGDLNTDIPGGGRSDEIGLLASALGVFRQSLERKRELEEAGRDQVARLEQSESELRKSQHLLQSVTDNAEAFIFVKDLQGRYLFVNRLYLSLLKRSAADILGRTVHDIFPPEAAAGFAQGESEVLTTGVPQVGQATMFSHDGVPRYFLAHKFPLFDEQGRMFAIGGVSTDVTQIKKTE